ncbi:Glycine betaine methyltransferase [subsurface metagenome]
MLSNPAAYVLCDEIISYCKIISKGFTLDENDVAFETIKKVGHGGHYLRERHTLKNYRKIVWRPMYSNRENPIQWIKKGEKSFKDIATARAKEILKTHSPQKLPENVLNAIDQLVKQAYSELKDMKFKS